MAYNQDSDDDDHYKKMEDEKPQQRDYSQVKDLSQQQIQNDWRKSYDEIRKNIDIVNSQVKKCTSDVSMAKTKIPGLIQTNQIPKAGELQQSIEASLARIDTDIATVATQLTHFQKIKTLTVGQESQHKTAYNSI